MTATPLQLRRAAAEVRGLPRAEVLDDQQRFHALCRVFEELLLAIELLEPTTWASATGGAVRAAR